MRTSVRAGPCVVLRILAGRCGEAAGLAGAVCPSRGCFMDVALREAVIRQLKASAPFLSHQQWVINEMQERILKMIFATCQ